MREYEREIEQHEDECCFDHYCEEAGFVLHNLSIRSIGGLAPIERVRCFDCVHLSAHSAQREEYLPRKGWTAQREEHPAERNEVEGKEYAAELDSGLHARIIYIETCFGEITPTVLEEETKSVPGAPQDKVQRNAMP